MADNKMAPQGGVTDPMMQDQQIQPEPTALDGDQSGKGPVAANTAGAPTQGEQKSDQAPKPEQTPQQSQPGQQTEQQQQQGAPQAPKQQTPDQSQPPASVVHPAVQKASLVHDIAQALAGGPRFTTTIDPNTGTTTRTQVPVSGKQLAMAIALQALGGAVAGLGAKGPDNEAQALQAGFAQGAKQQQQAQAAEQRQGEQANNDLARQAAITQTNFQTHQNAMRLGQMEYDQHKQYVDDAKPVLENLQQVGGIKDSGVREGDLLNKYHVTKDMAVVDGIVPRMNADGTQATDPKTGHKLWDNTYSVIDPEAHISLPDDTAKFLADHHVNGYFKMDGNGKAVPITLPQSAQLKARMVVDGLATASAIRISESAINQQLSTLDPQDQKKFEVSLTQGLDSGAVSTKALKTYAQFSNVPFSNLRAEMEKAKIDPDTIGQIMSLIPKDAIDASKTQVADQTAQAKADEQRRNLVVSKSNFEDVLAAPDKYSKDQVSAAKSMKQQVAADESRKAYASGRAGEQGRIDAKKANGVPLSGSASAGASGSVKDMIKDPNVANIAIDPNEKNLQDGVNETYLEKLRQANPNLAALVEQIGHGQQMQSAYGLAKNDGQVLGSMVARAFPDYQFQKAESFGKMYNSFTSGKDKDQIEAGNTTFRHVAAAYNAASNPQSYNPLSTAHTDYLAAVDKVMEESHSAYSSGVMHKEEAERAQDYMKSNVPWQRKEGFRMIANLLADKSGEKQNSFRRGKPTAKIPDFEIISPDAQDAFKHVTGKQIGTNGFVEGSRSGSPNNHAGGQPAYSHVTKDGKFGFNGAQWVPLKPQQ